MAESKIDEIGSGDSSDILTRQSINQYLSRFGTTVRSLESDFIIAVRRHGNDGSEETTETKRNPQDDVK